MNVIRIEMKPASEWSLAGIEGMSLWCENNGPWQLKNETLLERTDPGIEGMSLYAKEWTLAASKWTLTV